MSTIVDTLDKITAWTQINICNPVDFKLPPIIKNQENDEIRRIVERDISGDIGDAGKDGAGYEYKRVTPVAFTWFFPSKDKLPPNIKAPTPAVCVRLSDGNDNRNIGNMNIELCFAVWNPGTHGSDIIFPSESESYTQWTGEEASEYFERNAEGWRDVWNWVDLALRKIESAESISGIMIDKSSIKFGAFKTEGLMVDFYPFWHSYISFDISRSIVRNVKEYEDFL